MALILLRIARRSATLEERDLQTIVETEFWHEGRPDLRLSVYNIRNDATDIVRAYTGHSASVPNLDAPFRSRHHFDVSGLEPRPVVVVPIATGFEFLSAAHREIPFENDTELRRFVEQLRDEFPRRQRHVSKQDAEGYVKQRLLESDSEWLALRAKGGEWGNYLGKLTRR